MNLWFKTVFPRTVQGKITIGLGILCKEKIWEPLGWTALALKQEWYSYT